MNARRSASIILARIEKDGAYSNLALMAEFARNPDAQDVDKRLTTELVYGVLRNRRLLDAWIDHLADKPQKLDPIVRRILQLALYQLIALDRIPVHATLNESGKLCKHSHRPHAVGLVNALLRRFLRERETAALPPLPDDPIARLAVEFSVPDWLMARWIDEESQPDPELLLARLRARADFINHPAPLVLAPNPLHEDSTRLAERFEAVGVSATPGEYDRDALVIGPRGFELMTQVVASGSAHVMDEAAQLVTHLVDPQPGERILDLCAAPGGKSLWMAAKVGPKGRVVSVDLSESKLGLLQDQARKCGFTWIKTLAADASRPIAALEGQTFDRVLVDAPCSALGIIRRHPEIRWRRQADDIPKLATLARAIATNAMHYVKPGGTLAFSVCTTTPEEGPQQLDALAAMTGWSVETHPAIAAELWKHSGPHAYMDTSQSATLDGFCAFRLRNSG
jgi:16S rRNA (cytosine967-C5)-methyltransferase